MSGIYIPKMEMPKNCNECPIAQGYFKPAYCGLNGSIPKLWEEFDDALEKEIRPDFCPLIEVPKHGRLIDADALHEHMVKVHNEWKEHPKLHESIVPVVDDEVMVLYFPTIIPADKDGAE